MASAYSDRLRFEKQENGANSETWGTKLNTGFDLIDDAIAGMATIATTGGTSTLSSSNAVADESRMAILKITGVLVSNSTVVVPAKTKLYTVWNATSGAYTVTVKVSGQTGVAVPQGVVAAVFCDATDVYNAVSGIAGSLAVVDGSFSVVGSADATKIAKFEVDGLTTGTTRTYTLPDASGTVALTSNKLSAFAATTSAELAGVISDETGSGLLVFATSPVLTTPSIGVATATSINKVAITAPATSATLTIADGKTLTINETLTFTGTAGTTMTFPTTSATLARTDSPTFTGTITAAALTASGLITANAGLTVASGQTLTLTGATVAGTPTINGDWLFTSIGEAINVSASTNSDLRGMRIRNTSTGAGAYASYTLGDSVAFNTGLIALVGSGNAAYGGSRSMFLGTTTTTPTVIIYNNVEVGRFTGTGLTVTGGQIKFPATQVPSADVNTLDDYEEGTWTPSVGGTATYTIQTGTYTKIGRQVTIRGTLQINVIGTGSQTTISGLPFAAAAGSITFVFPIAVDTATAASYVHLHGNLVGGSSSIVIAGKTAAATTDTGQSALTSSTGIHFSGSYFV